ncbi:hypothetical protein, partial [Arenibacter certesii]|uniref:hypothetical protein n=1 Tax=Arenibacter certesii TaxID=228955 RepID=UPI001969BF3E
MGLLEYVHSCKNITSNPSGVTNKPQKSGCASELHKRSSLLFLKLVAAQLFVVFKAELCREGRSQSLYP